MKKSIPHFIYFLSLFLISEPLFRILTFKASTGLEFALVWDNVVSNSMSSVPMFIKFWVLSPLAGILLLSLSQTAYFIFSGLTVFNIYQYLTYRSFEWPYFAKTPHWSATLLLLMNVAFLGFLLWPTLKRRLLSRYFRHVWDARGRYQSLISSTAFINDKGYELSGLVENISSGGVLLSSISSYQAQIGDHGVLVLKDYQNDFLPLQFKVVNRRDLDGKTSYGLEFQNVNPKKRLQIYQLLALLEEKRKRPNSRAHCLFSGSKVNG